MNQADAIRIYFLKYKSGTTRDLMVWFNQNGVPYNSMKTVSGHLSKMYSRGELKRSGTPNCYIYYK